MNLPRAIEVFQFVVLAFGAAFGADSRAFAEVAAFSASAVSTQEVVAVWRGISGTSGYVVARSANGVSGWTNLATLGGAARSVRDPSVVPGELYFYQLTPTGAGGAAPPVLTTSVAVPPRDLLAGGVISTSALDLWRPGEILAMARQSDGKFVIVGSFTTVNGNARKNVARLNANGSLDATFNPSAGTDLTVRCVAIQPDGKILIAGDFSTCAGASAPRMARLTADGSLDTSFTSRLTTNVLAMQLLPDSRIVVGGGTFVRRMSSTGVPDSTIFPSFSIVPASISVSTQVNALALQPDGKLIVAGNFNTAAKESVTLTTHVARVNSDGTLDTTFAPVPLGAPYPLTPRASAIALQNDGKILIGGYFTTLASTSTFSSLVRLNADGTADPGFPFKNRIPLGSVSSLIVLTDGRIVATSSWYFAILSGNGTVNSSGQCVPGSVQSALVLPSGAFVFGGSFHSANGTRKQSIVKFAADASTIDASFNASTSQPGYLSAMTARPGGGTFLAGSFSSIGGPDSLGAPRYDHALLDQDDTLAPDFGTTPRFTSPPGCIATDASGKIWFGGIFFNISNPSSTTGRFLARLNADGSLDGSLTPAAPSSAVWYIIPEVDDGATVAGEFSSIGGASRSRLARIFADGTVAPDFASAALSSASARIARDRYGKLLIAGSFTSIFGQTAKQFLVRVGGEGTLDPTFSPNPDIPVSETIPDPSGAVWVSGNFTSIGGAYRPGLARLLEDGSADSGFVPAASGNLLAVDNSRCLVAGSYTSLKPGRTFRVIRLQPGGTFDPEFDVGTPPDSVPTEALTSGQDILFGGKFTTFGGKPRLGLVRVRSVSSVGPPAAPGGLAIAGLAMNSVTLDWQPVSGSAGYLVERSVAGNPGWQVVAALDAGAVTFEDAALISGSAWQYRVRATNVAGQSPASNTVLAALPYSYSQWLADWSIAPQSGADTDSDGDGLGLLAEYAVGLSPSAPDAAGAIAVAKTGDRLAITYQQARADVSYTVETSSDLSAWSTVGVDQGSPGPLVTASVGLTDSERVFIRLRVTLAP